MIKMLLIAGIIICSVLIGVYFKNYFLGILKIFKDFKTLCKTISNEILFLKTDKFSLLKNKQFESKQTQLFIDDYLVLGKGSCSLLKSAENKVLNDFLNSIGKKDVDGEIYNLKFYETLIEKEYLKAEENYKKYGIFSIKISIILGTLIAIILL